MFNAYFVYKIQQYIDNFNVVIKSLAFDNC